MAEHTKAHLWVNTGIAALALLASGASAIFTYRNFNLSTESIGLTATFTYDCLWSFSAAISGSTKTKRSQVGLCWKLLVSNQSTARVSIVDAFTNEGDEKQFQFSAELLKENNADLKLPLILDGGEARPIIARISVPGSPLLEKTIGDFVKAHTEGSYLADFAYFAAQNNLDALGNPVEKQEFVKSLWLTFQPNYKRTKLNLIFKTGRGNTFTTQLTFPSGDHDVVSPSNLRQRLP